MEERMRGNEVDNGETPACKCNKNPGKEVSKTLGRGKFGERILWGGELIFVEFVQQIGRILKYRFHP